MGFWGFQRLCLWRAGTDLRSYAIEHVRAAVLALVASIPTLPLAANLGSNMTQELWSIIIQSFIGPALVVALGFVWFWGRAPFVLWREAKGSADLPSASGETPPGSTDPVRLEFVWRSPDNLDQNLYATVTAVDRVAGLVLMGRYATATHYMSGTAEWLWSLPSRLWEADTLVPGETVLGIMLMRSHVSKNPGDTLRLLKDMNYVAPKGTDWEQGLMLLLEATAHHSGGEATERMVINIRRSGDRQFIDRVDASTLAGIEDHGRLSRA